MKDDKGKSTIKGNYYLSLRKIKKDKTFDQTTVPRDLKLDHYISFGREPFGEAICVA